MKTSVDQSAGSSFAANSWPTYIYTAYRILSRLSGGSFLGHFISRLTAANEPFKAQPPFAASSLNDSAGVHEIAKPIYNGITFI